MCVLLEGRDGIRSIIHQIKIEERLLNVHKELTNRHFMSLTDIQGRDQD